MNQIKETRLIEACNAKTYKANLAAVLEELQASGLAVEIKHSMSQAQKGVGYRYSAVVLGRQA